MAGKLTSPLPTEGQRATEDAIFAGLDDGQREQLRELLLALRNRLAGEPGVACAPAQTAAPESPGC